MKPRYARPPPATSPAAPDTPMDPFYEAMATPQDDPQHVDAGQRHDAGLGVRHAATEEVDDRRAAQTSSTAGSNTETAGGGTNTQAMVHDGPGRRPQRALKLKRDPDFIYY